MADLRQGFPSPCNQICVLNAEAVCVGCGRNSDEIGRWGLAHWDEQMQIAERASVRLQALNDNTTKKG